jgi:conjugative relaxase-like TrwC/TraI family protein
VHTLCRESAVTARVTTLKGPDAGAYYVEALPSYYLDAGEPRGRWHGHGAALLSLTGEVNDAPFLAVMAGDDPSSGVRLGRRYGQDSVRGFEITTSAPKSVSVLSPSATPPPAAGSSTPMTRPWRR